MADLFEKVNTSYFKHFYLYKRKRRIFSNASRNFFLIYILSKTFTKSIKKLTGKRERESVFQTCLFTVPRYLMLLLILVEL